MFVVRVVVAVNCDCSFVCFSISAICCLCWEGADISIPRMMSLISDWVKEATFTLRNGIRTSCCQADESSISKVKGKKNHFYTLKLLELTCSSCRSRPRWDLLTQPKSQEKTIYRVKNIFRLLTIVSRICKNKTKQNKKQQLWHTQVLQAYILNKGWPTSTGTHSSSLRVGQMWWGSVMVVLSGFRITLVLSAFTCNARRMRIRREKAVYDDMVFNQSSYRLNSTIWGSVAFRIMSPSFST